MNHDIEAYLDGTLDPEARAAFEAQLARDPALHDAVADARRVRDDLSWLAVEKGIKSGEQAFWEKETTQRNRNRWFWLVWGRLPLLIAGIAWWQWGADPERAKPEQQQQQPSQPNNLPTALDSVAPSTPDSRETPENPKKQAGNADTRNRLFAENFKPYKDETLEPSRRGATKISPAEQFQQLYWEEKHRAALVAFETLNAADKNNATGRAEEATTLLEQIIRNDRTRFMAEAKWYLALSYLETGKTEQSKSMLKSISSDPQSPRQPDAKRLLGQWK